MTNYDKNNNDDESDNQSWYTTWIKKTVKSEVLHRVRANPNLRRRSHRFQTTSQGIHLESISEDNNNDSRNNLNSSFSTPGKRPNLNSSFSTPGKRPIHNKNDYDEYSNNNDDDDGLRQNYDRMCSPDATKVSSNNSNNNNDKHMKQDEDIPYLLQVWRNAYMAIPRHESINISFTLATAIVLSCLRFFIEFVQIFVFGWPSDDAAALANNGGVTTKEAFLTKQAASSMVAIFHSTCLVPGLILCFYSLHWTLGVPYQPSQRLYLETVPQWWRDVVTALLQFCTGYMIYDGILNVVLLKLLHTPEGTLRSEDYMFMGHHLATAIYMSATRYLQAGHLSAMMCMLLGEATNPFHNSYYVAQSAMQLSCCNGAKMRIFFNIVSLFFASTYVVMRSVVGPIICIHMTYDLVKNGRKNGIPIAWIAVWNLLIWGVLIGSIPWIQDCWSTILLRHPYLPTFVKSILASLTGGLSTAGRNEL